MGDLIVNLGCLGVQLQSKHPGTQSGGCKQYWKEVMKTAKATAETESITRHTSWLRWVLQSHQSNSLKEDDFKWIVKPQDTGRSKVGMSYRKHRGKNNDSKKVSGNRPKYIVFFLGGVSYAEIKTCYQLSREKDVDIFVGSTLLYSPQGYLQCFHKERMGIMITLNPNRRAMNRFCGWCFLFVSCLCSSFPISLSLCS